MQSETSRRGGKLVDTCDPRIETSRSMAEKMIGGNLKTIQKPAGRTFGAEKFVVNRLNLPGVGQFGISLKDITFSVKAGEIFGIAGVAGNGQNALLLALSGEEPVDVGRSGDEDHPHPHVHHAVALVAVHAAAVPDRAEDRGRLPRVRADDGADSLGEDARNVVGEAAARDVRHRLDPPTREQREEERRVAAVDGEERVGD